MGSTCSSGLRQDSNPFLFKHDCADKARSLPGELPVLERYLPAVVRVKVNVRVSGKS